MLLKIWTAVLVLLVGGLVYFFGAGPTRIFAEDQTESSGINGVVRGSTAFSETKGMNYQAS